QRRDRAWRSSREQAAARRERLAADEDLDRALIPYRKRINGRGGVGAQEDLDPVRLQQAPDHEGLRLIADAGQLLERALVFRLGRARGERDHLAGHAGSRPESSGAPGRGGEEVAPGGQSAET